MTHPTYEWPEVKGLMSFLTDDFIDFCLLATQHSLSLLLQGTDFSTDSSFLYFQIYIFPLRSILHLIKQPGTLSMPLEHHSKSF